MPIQGLTTDQCLLLQRFHDGELGAAQGVEAEQLLARAPAARVFLQALEEIGRGVRAGSELAWERGRDGAPEPAEVARLAALAAQGGHMLRAPLEELLPLLDRVHDGEADAAEVAWVQAMLPERADAGEYLAGLGQIAEQLRDAQDHALQDVRFDGFWERVRAGINAEETEADSARNFAQNTTPGTVREGAGGAREQGVAPDFEVEEHLCLLHRFADLETSEAEDARVQAWVDQQDQQVDRYLAALTEIKLGVNVAVETACERAPLRDIWSGVQRAIETPQEDAAPGALAGAGRGPEAPISLEEARRNRRGGWLGQYQQAAFGAAAAAVVVLGVVGLFKDQLFGPNERVIVEKTIEKRVVIVESVEYSPGASVMIDSPMTRVGLQKGQPEASQDAAGGEVNPTVIWLFEADQDGDTPLEILPGLNASDEDEDSGRRGQPI